MTKHIQVNITDYFFNNADELENSLRRIGERITNGQYKAGVNQIVVNNRVLGEVRIAEKQLSFVQCLKAGHDKNGNRRAIFIQYDLNGNIEKIYKYGNKIPSGVFGCVTLPDVNVSNKELQEWIQTAKTSNRIEFIQGE